MELEHSTRSKRKGMLTIDNTYEHLLLLTAYSMSFRPIGIDFPSKQLRSTLTDPEYPLTVELKNRDIKKLQQGLGQLATEETAEMEAQFRTYLYES